MTFTILSEIQELNTFIGIMEDNNTKVVFPHWRFYLFNNKTYLKVSFPHKNFIISIPNFKKG